MIIKWKKVFSRMVLVVSICAFFVVIIDILSPEYCMPINVDLYKNMQIATGEYIKVVEIKNDYYLSIPDKSVLEKNIRIRCSKEQIQGIENLKNQQYFIIYKKRIFSSSEGKLIDILTYNPFR